MRFVPRLLLALLLLVSVVGFARSGKPAALVPPPGIQLTPLRTISKLEARVLLRLSGLKGLPVAHAVDCYRMEYPGVGPKGEAVVLSGLLALPSDTVARRLVSFQHGTSTTRSAVPSKPDGTGLAAAILFAGSGYALIAPDYPGMGSSPGRHPYYEPRSIGTSVVSMIDAARQLKGVPDAPVFLSGFSEGGWASLQALRVLEARGTPVFGVASIAGPINVSGVQLPSALTEGTSHSLYLAYAAWGQAAYYGHRLDSVLTSQNALEVERLFGGADPKEILKGLPQQPRRLFNSDFLAAYDGGKSHWYTDALAAADLTDLMPRAPVRLYYGSNDKDVVPQDAILAARRIAGSGGEAASIDVGPVDHNASMLAAAPLVLSWLAQLEARAARPAN